MERNLILAIILSVIIITLFHYLSQTYYPPPKPEPAGPTVPQPVQQEPAKMEPMPQPVEKVPEPSVLKPQPLLPPGEAAVSSERKITINTPKYEAVFSSIGARIISFKLKAYKQNIDDDRPINLFSSDAPDTSGPSLVFVVREDTFSDAELPYVCDSPLTTITIDDQNQPKSLTFRGVTGSGLVISKTYSFSADSYVVGFQLSMTNESSEDKNYLVTFPWRKSFRQNSSEQLTWNSTEIMLNGELKDYYFQSVDSVKDASGRVEWVGMGDVHFIKAIVFGEKSASKVTILPPTKTGVAEVLIRYGSVDIPKGSAIHTDLKLYFGPKEAHFLAAAGSNLERALYYSSWFSRTFRLSFLDALINGMCEYLLKFLKLCHSGFTVAGVRVPGLHNYGIAIILLTVLIKILFIPLTHKSMKSMKRMQELQPLLAKIKEKYKDDKAAQNKATMELFREHKVNPLGSCWPMFLQLPVFIALYQTLAYSIELRHAPFVCIPSLFLCIKDLSAADPYYVTPILMGLTMALQQWMTPSTGDPTQKKMMMVLPVVFTFFFLNFPAGLVLYWLVNNILSIAQQYITNRMLA